MAGYNSRYKYNSGTIYNNRIYFVNTGGAIALIGAIARRVSFVKNLISNISIYGTTNRMSSFFRRAGYEFSYNKGLKYNMPIERNGNVNISGNISRVSLFVRYLAAQINITAMISRKATFYRVSGNAFTNILSGITKRTSKTITGYIFTSGIITRLSRFFRGIAGNVNTSSSLSNASKFFRSLTANITTLAIIKHIASHKRTIGNGNMLVFTLLNRGTIKTISNGNISSIGTTLKSTLKQFSSSITSSSIINIVRQYLRTLQSEISISTSFSKKISKAITHIININGNISRVSTFFRHAGYMFSYNIVSITGHVSSISMFFRNITSLVASSGTFSRVVSLKRLTGNAQIAVTVLINKSIKKYVSGIFSTISSLSRQNNKLLSSAVNLSGFISKRSQLFRAIGANITIQKEFLKVLVKNLYGSISPSSVITKISTFYRNFSTSIQVTRSIEKKVYKAITGFVTSSGSVIKAFGLNLSAELSIIGSLWLSTLKNLNDAIYIHGYLSRLTTFYRIFASSVSISTLLDKATTYIRAIGSAVINPFGTASKAISKFFFGAVLISRNIMNRVGDGVVYISSSLKRLKYYFFVTLDNTLMPLGVKIARDSYVNMVPSTRDNAVEIPGKHGEIDFGTELGKRLIELHVVTDEMTPEERELTKLKIAKHVGGDIPKSLVFEEDLSKTYDVKYAGQLDLTQYPNWMDLTIPFKTTEPVIMGSYEKEHSSNGVIKNEGTFEAPIVIEIRGPLSDPIVNIGNEQLTYAGFIPNNTSLVIDTKSMTAKINGENVLKNISGDITLKLQPGETSITANDNVTIKWRDCWL